MTCTSRDFNLLIIIARMRYCVYAIGDLYLTENLHCCHASSNKAMKSPGGSTFASLASEDDDWTAFDEACPCDCHAIDESRGAISAPGPWAEARKVSTFESCFPAVQSSPVVSTGSRESRDNHTIGLEFLENLCHCSTAPDTVGQHDRIMSKSRDVVFRDVRLRSLSTGQPVLDLPADSDPFDWQQKEKEIDPVPNFVRPGKPESPVDINFDHSQAAFGLSQLGEEDLKQMKWEMSDKFRHLSEVLVGELQTRDLLIHSLNVKNTFISAMLKVQSIRYHPSSSEEKPASTKYLHSVIPFLQPNDGNWSTSMLQKLTKILDAIAGNSDSVPDLVSSYIQAEVLKE